MTSEQLLAFMEQQGYGTFETTQEGVQVCYQAMGQMLMLVCVIDHVACPEVSDHQISLCTEQASSLFLSKGFLDVHTLYLLLSNDPLDPLQIRIRSWLVDAQNLMLTIGEEAPEDFYGLKNLLQQGLSDGMPYVRAVSPVLEEQRYIPYVTAALAVVNFIIYCISAFTGDVLYNIGDFNIQLVLEKQEYYRLLTSMFLHINLTHLSGNMILLLVAGKVIEKYCGHLTFFIGYLLSGIAGDMVSGAYDLLSGTYTYSVGASGAIMGMIGALLAIVILHKGHYREITLGRVLFMIAYILYFGFTGTNVNNLAHIGGAICGFVLLMLRHLIRGQRGSQNEN